MAWGPHPLTNGAKLANIPRQGIRCGPHSLPYFARNPQEDSVCVRIDALVVLWGYCDGWQNGDFRSSIRIHHTVMAMIVMVDMMNRCRIGRGSCWRWMGRAKKIIPDLSARPDHQGCTGFRILNFLPNFPNTVFYSGSSAESMPV